MFLENQKDYENLLLQLESVKYLITYLNKFKKYSTPAIYLKNDSFIINWYQGYNFLQITLFSKKIRYYFQTLNTNDNFECEMDISKFLKNMPIMEYLDKYFIKDII